MADYGPQVTLARLYRKQSAKGATYFRGRLGMANIVLLKSKDFAYYGNEIWNLVLSEAPKREGDAPAKAQVAAPTQTRLDPPQRTPMREREIDEDIIPF